ncbi:cytochrome P450 [Rhodococcus sp. WS4]|nr:cytochrome P450 [Rhodococcus sp. WS4]
MGVLEARMPRNFREDSMSSSFDTRTYSHELNWPDGLVPMKFVDDDGSMSEPFAQYAWLRGNAPAVRLKTEGEDVWMITRYDDVRAGSRNPKVFRSHAGGGDAPRFTFLPQFDAPEHTRLRRAYAEAFNPKSVALVEDSVRARAQVLLDAFLAEGSGDIVEQVAMPLTMYTIGSIMEVPVEDIDKMKAWSDDALLVHAAGRGLPSTPTAERNAEEFFEYLQNLLEELYAKGSPSVGGHIARLWKEGVLTDKEARELTGFLFVAGHDTTTLLIGNAVRQLVEEPALLERLRENPGDAVAFVEEIVRYHGTVHRTSRRVAENVVIDGTTIPAGSFVRLVVASANRDGSRFENPDVFDIDRANSGHVGFGHGVHSCIGAPLARLEARIAVELMAKTFGSIEFDSRQPVELMRGHMITLGAKHVVVKVRPVDGPKERSL